VGFFVDLRLPRTALSIIVAISGWAIPGLLFASRDRHGSHPKHSELS